MIKQLLKNDIEYQYKILKNEYSLKWGIKRVIKKILYFIPRFKKFELYYYFLLHKLRLAHWYKLMHNFFIKKEIYLSFQSGFGDMLEVYPYFLKVKEKYPNHKVFAVIHHPDFCKFEEMSFCKGSFLEVDGKKIDYVKEFIETNPNIDKIIYNDCWGDGYIYGHPVILKDIFGFAFKKDEFLKNISYLFSNEDKKIGDEFTKKHNLDKDKTIAIHFKTSKEKLKEIIKLIISDKELNNINFLLFGSVDKDIEQEIISKGFDVVNLSGSYKKGINTRQLIYIASKSTFFLGGRGGFNAIYYLLDIPTINIFDFQGKQEMANGLWPSNLWEENEVGKLFWGDNENKEIYGIIKNCLA